jgi:predicted O-methyltransferase YrrM
MYQRILGCILLAQLALYPIPWTLYVSDKDLWTRVDDYVTSTLVKQDDALVQALADSDAAGLPAISVSPAHGKLLHLLARIVGARRILEIGTLGGYSTIWLARALPQDGRLISLELAQKHADVARANIDRAGVGERVEIRVGKALDLLPSLGGTGPFDLVFIDADKQNNSGYFEWAVTLSRPGGVIIVDNVIRNGAVIDAESNDEMVQGVRRLNELMNREVRVDVTAIQTVGVKGYDGFSVALVR